MDRNVTLAMGHAIKIPFCVHPSTNNVCHVMNTEQALDFYPTDDSVIRCSTLVNSAAGDEDEERQRFAESVHVLDTHLNQMQLPLPLPPALQV